MVVELFLDLRSQPCRALFIFAKKNNIPFEFKDVELLKGHHLSEEFGKVNVLKKVPALKDGAFTLAESIAILLYLSRKFNTPDHWYPSDLQKRARVDEYLSWQHTTIREKGCKIFITKVLVPLAVGQPFSQEKLEEAVEELNSALKQFEEKFLQDKPFIVGNEISLADLVAIVELMQPVGCGCDIFENRPKLVEWRSRVEEAVGKELFQQAHEIILNVKNMSTTQLPPELRDQSSGNFLSHSSPGGAASVDGIFFSWQQHSDGFGKVNILRKVPALKDGGFTLEESPAILTYLSQKYKTPDHWYPLDMKKRARVDEYLSWHHSAIRSSVFKIFWLKNMDRTFCPRASTFAKGLEGLWLTKCLTDWRPLVVFPLYMDQTAPEEKLQEALEDLTIPLKQLEEKFLQDKPFLVGNMISLADLVAVTELMQLIAIGYNILEDRPKLVEWRNRVEKAVGKELFQEAHKVILNFQDLNSMLIEPQLKEQMKPRLLKMVA